MRFQKVIWSLCEIDYLKEHSTDSVNQLCIYLSKSRAQVIKKTKELASNKTCGHTPKKSPYKSIIGKREDLGGLFLRSRWEGNTMRLLKQDPKVKEILYEPETFSFAPFGILKGTVSYTPDFKVIYKDGSYSWLEVKGGWMKHTDRTKIKRFMKYFPAEYAKLKVVVPSPQSKTTLFFTKLGVPVLWHYNEINKKWKDIIPHWE